MPEMPWTAMHERAAESIEFIRETMVRSASFTAVPGQGGVAMGAIGIPILGERTLTFARLQPRQLRRLGQAVEETFVLQVP